MEYKWKPDGVIFTYDSKWMNEPRPESKTFRQKIGRWLGERGWFGIKLPLTNKQLFELLKKDVEDCHIAIARHLTERLYDDRYL